MNTKFIISISIPLLLFLAVFLFSHWSRLTYMLNSIFRSNWSRWIDTTFQIKSSYHNNTTYILYLLQRKVNSRTGKVKFKEVYVVESADQDFLLDVAYKVSPNICKPKNKKS